MTSRVWVFVVTVVVAACSSSDRSIDRGEASNAWTTFGGTAETAAVPSGWIVADPFTRKTGFFLGHTMVGPGTDAGWQGSDVALIRSPDALESQAYLFRGPVEVWQPRLEKGFDWLDHPLVSIDDRGTLVTADGVALRYIAARIDNGLVAGDRLSYFLAYGTVDGELFIIDAGGPTGRFRVSEIQRFVQSLTPLDDSERTVVARADPLAVAVSGEGRNSPLGEEEDAAAAVRDQVMRFLPPDAR